MDRRTAARVAFGATVVLLAAVLAASFLTAGSEVTDRYDTGDVTVAPPGNTTVVTTSPRQTTDASIVAFGPDGRVAYYNETYDYYFDVDPVEGTAATVEYAAVELFTEGCAVESAIERGGTCSRSLVERVNLTTGETTRIYSQATRPVGIGGWHDVDRLNETHLLVAGGVNDRVFIVNTSSEIVEWQWSAQSAFDISEGGRFPADWSHINDVERLDDGRIMVSMRNQDQVVFIDPQRGVLPEWTLGSDDEYDVLYEQHNPDYIPAERGGPALLVADSENNRLVEYQRRNGEWEQSWVWQDEQLQWGRDADRLPNGHTLVTDSNGNRVFEVAENGSVVWSVPIDTPYEAERLDTGDESTGGASASSLGLESRSAAEESGDGDDESLLSAVIDGVQGVLPPVIVNGLLFVLPPWVAVSDLVAFALLVLVALAWVVAEFRWAGYTLRLPVGRRPE